MAGLEDYPELRGGKYRRTPHGSNNESPMQMSSPRKRVPLLIEQPPTLVNESDSSFDMDHYANLGMGTVGLILHNIGTHPFIVLRRQCQVSAESYRCHRTPVTLIPVVVNMYRLQGFSSMWKGLGSALTVRGLLLAVEDCTGKLTPWPAEVDSTSSLRMVGQHLLLKAVSQALVVPFFSASLVECVQSDIASEKPGIFDFLKEGLIRLGPQSGARTLPMWQLIPPSVIHSVAHYIISTIVKAVSSKIMKSRHRALQEQQGAISKPKGTPPGLSQYREQLSSVIGFLAADVILYPIETVLHRLHLQGTRTIIDNLESGREVVPIITRYEGFVDCLHSIVSEEGFSGFFKGFGSLMLQYALHFMLLRVAYASIQETVRLVASPPPFPAPSEADEFHKNSAEPAMRMESPVTSNPSPLRFPSPPLLDRK